MKGNSATRDCLLFRSGIFENVYNVKEYKDESEGVKPAVDMNVAEMSYASIIQDFIGGLCKYDSTKGIPFVGNNHFLFLAAVMSDKNTIAKIRVNLNKILE